MTVKEQIKQAVIRQRRMKQSSSLSQKEKEIVVWIRLQEFELKDQFLNDIQAKFDISEQESQKLFSNALPHFFTEKDEEVLSNVAEDILFLVEPQEPFVIVEPPTDLQEIDTEIVVLSLN